MEVMTGTAKSGIIGTYRYAQTFYGYHTRDVTDRTRVESALENTTRTPFRRKRSPEVGGMNGYGD